MPNLQALLAAATPRPWQTGTPPRGFRHGVARPRDDSDGLPCTDLIAAFAEFRERARDGEETANRDLVLHAVNHIEEYKRKADLCDELAETLADAVVTLEPLCPSHSKEFSAIRVYRKTIERACGMGAENVLRAALAKAKGETE